MDWVAVGTWFNATAMAVAAFFAWRAWRAQEHDARRQRLAAAIRDLTTGRVARARDAVTAWAVDFGQCAAPDDRGDHGRMVRGDDLIDNDKVRHQVFVVLWALHRLSPLVADLQHATREERDLLRLHIGLVLDSLSSLPRLSAGEQQMLSHSMSVAADVVLKIGELLGGVDLGVEWALLAQIPLAKYERVELDSSEDS